MFKRGLVPELENNVPQTPRLHVSFIIFSFNTVKQNVSNMAFLRVRFEL